jgi:hypothetical protein
VLIFCKLCKELILLLICGLLVQLHESFKFFFTSIFGSFPRGRPIDEHLSATSLPWESCGPKPESMRFSVCQPRFYPWLAPPTTLIAPLIFNFIRATDVALRVLCLWFAQLCTLTPIIFTDIRATDVAMPIWHICRNATDIRATAVWNVSTCAVLEVVATENA